MRLVRKALQVLGGFTSADFTYTGTYTWVDDGNGNFRLKFLTSGIFTPRKTIYIDIFLVGGGGGVVYPTDDYTYGSGGAGYTRTYLNFQLIAGTAYTVTIGAGGGLWTAGGKSWFYSEANYYANGGACGTQVPTGITEHVTTGGAGGSGGAGTSGHAGGQDGAAGANYAWIGQYWRFGGTGQGSTTREFGEASGALYARGGGAGTPISANTGNGGIDCYGSTPGSSGICIIRNHRAA